MLVTNKRLVFGNTVYEISSAWTLVITWNRDSFPSIISQQEKSIIAINNSSNHFRKKGECTEIE